MIHFGLKTNIYTLLSTDYIIYMDIIAYSGYIYSEPIKISGDIIFRWEKSKGIQGKGGIIKEDFIVRKYHRRF